MWRNWQTRRLQVPVSFSSWRFDSSHPHLNFTSHPACSPAGFQKAYNNRGPSVFDPTQPGGPCCSPVCSLLTVFALACYQSLSAIYQAPFCFAVCERSRIVPYDLVITIEAVDAGIRRTFRPDLDYRTNTGLDPLPAADVCQPVSTLLLNLLGARSRYLLQPVVRQDRQVSEVHPSVTIDVPRQASRLSKLQLQSRSVSAVQVFFGHRLKGAEGLRNDKRHHSVRVTSYKISTGRAQIQCYP